MNHVEKLLALASVVAGASGVDTTFFRNCDLVHLCTRDANGLLSAVCGVGAFTNRVTNRPDSVTCPACRESKEWKEAMEEQREGS